MKTAFASTSESKSCESEARPTILFPTAETFHSGMPFSLPAFKATLSLPLTSFKTTLPRSGPGLPLLSLPTISKQPSTVFARHLFAGNRSIKPFSFEFILPSLSQGNGVDPKTCLSKDHSIILDKDKHIQAGSSERYRKNTKRLKQILHFRERSQLLFLSVPSPNSNDSNINFQTIMKNTGLAGRRFFPITKGFSRLITGSKETAVFMESGKQKGNYQVSKFRARFRYQPFSHLRRTKDHVAIMFIRGVISSLEER